MWEMWLPGKLFKYMSHPTIHQQSVHMVRQLVISMHHNIKKYVSNPFKENDKPWDGEAKPGPEKQQILFSLV